MEFYRAVLSMLPKGYFVSPNAARSLAKCSCKDCKAAASQAEDVKDAKTEGGDHEHGWLDFIINSSLKLGVEVLRDGCDMKEHASRFAKGGRYWPLFHAGVIKRHILIDFRSPAKAVRSVCAFALSCQFLRELS